MPAAWYRFLSSVVTRVYFGSATLVPGRPIREGPVVWIALHRNGAVDGFVYHHFFRRAVFMLAAQLRKNAVARVFFGGIEVVRGKDRGDRSDNEAALRRCVEHVRGGGDLCVMPEGTSSLGPRHLPFKAGAAQIVLDLLDAGADFAVRPLGIHYDRAWAFRSDVEVVVGDPVHLEHLPECEGRARLKELRRRMKTALLDVGINVDTVESQHVLETYATLRPRPRWATLKAHEGGLPDGVRETILAAGGRTEITRLPRPLAALLLAPLGLLTVCGALANVPPLVAAELAGRRCADDTNVITLWRVLVGFPVWWLWMACVVVATFGLGWQIAAIYVVATAGGLVAYAPARRIAAALGNPYHARLLELSR
jgi:1-acyl-sn-glycerol-3-phosphate acyltransferase